jgi:hypothetical protein
MGGSTKETNTTSSQSQATRQASEQASRQATQQATTPWAATSGLLGNLLNQIGGLSPNLTETESGALGQLAANASAGNPWASQIGGVANTLLAGGGPDRTPMINGAYDQYRAALAPFARGDYVDPASDPALRSYLDVLKNDVSSQVNGMFAGAGRDLSGMNQQALARGITQAEAPVLLDAYNRALAGQRSAIDALYGAGGQTAGLLSNLDQARLANQQAGIGAADAALTAQNWGPTQQLAVEAQRRGIPLQTLAAQYGMVLPAAQAFATTAGTSSGSSSGTTSGTSVGSGTQQKTEARPSIRGRSPRWRSCRSRAERAWPVVLRRRWAAVSSVRSPAASWGRTVSTDDRTVDHGRHLSRHIRRRRWRRLAAARRGAVGTERHRRQPQCHPRLSRRRAPGRQSRAVDRARAARLDGRRAEGYGGAGPARGVAVCRRAARPGSRPEIRADAEPGDCNAVPAGPGQAPRDERHGALRIRQEAGLWRHAGRLHSK